MQTQDGEVLTILQEECAELIQISCKCFRFGYGSVNPLTKLTNKQHLTQEIGDVLAMIDFCYKEGITTPEATEAAKQVKFAKLKKWSELDISR
jgi:NTP pyrophosphatase (non-canonical NTP hydrolase)